MEPTSSTPSPHPPAGRTRTYQLLAALILGIVVGLLLRRLGPHGISAAHTLGQFGQLWLNALRMTLIPLVFCLMVAGVASIARTASGGRLVRIAGTVFLGLLLLGSIIGAVTALGLMALWPLAQMHTATPYASTAPPSLLAAFVSLVPPNPIASAAEGSIAPLIVFALFLGAAIVRIKPEGSRLLLDILGGVTDAMLLIIDWVLLLAPAGIFFLLLDTIASVGTNAAKGLLQFAILLSALAAFSVVVAQIFGMFSGVGPSRFSRAAFPPQTLAVTTQSSTACLPALLEAAFALRLPAALVDAMMPLAVATFRFGNVISAMGSGLIGARLFGIHPTATQIATAMGIGILTNIGSVGVPGAAVLLAAFGPVYLALGTPLEALTLYIAIITVPDMFITTANVTADLAATSLISTLSAKRIPPADPQ